MAITMDGIFVNGQKATFRPEDILTGDASAYTEEIGTAVEAWMEENVTGGEQVTDTTLTLPGVPADAKVTGNKIDELKEDLNDDLYDSVVDLDIISGEFVRSASGEIESNSSYSRTDYIDAKTAQTIRLSWISDDRLTLNAICFYDSAKRYINGVADPLKSTDESKEYAIPSNAEYIIFSGYTRGMNHASATLLNITSPIRKLDLGIAEVDGNLKQIISDYYIPNFDAGTEMQMTFQSNQYWNIEGTTAVLTSNNAYKASEVISVTPNEDYQLSFRSGGSLKLSPWVVVDENYNILTYGEKTTSTITKTESFKIPQNGKYLLITVLKTNTPTLVKASYTPLDNPLYGKKIAIIGDSISTNGNSGIDANVPEIKVENADIGIELSAYLTYYDVQAGLSLGGHTFTSDEIGTEVTFTPVEGDVGKVIGLPNNYNDNTVTTWWEVMQDALNCSFIPNTWSGASITSHEGDSSQYKTSYGWHEATIRKCGIRTPGTMTRNEPDAIIIYRGTNDFSHSPYAMLTSGYFDNYEWQYPESDVVTGGYGYKEGLCLTIKKLRDAYPNAKIFLCTLNVFKRVNYSHFPTNNGSNSLPQYNNAIREVADFMGCGVIDFDKDGITFENCYSQGYITDSSTIPTHPSDKGHMVMGLKAITDMKAQYSNMF